MKSPVYFQFPGLPLNAKIDPFFSCRKASKGRPLQDIASVSTAAVGPCVEFDEEGEVTRTVLKVGVRAVAKVAPVTVGSSVPSNVSPRATEKRRDVWVDIKKNSTHQIINSLFSEMVIFSCNTDFFWGRQCRSLHSSFHSTRTWSHTDICSVVQRSHSDPHRTLWRCSLCVSVWAEEVFRYQCSSVKYSITFKMVGPSSGVTK